MESQDSEKLKVDRLQALVLKGYDSFENGSVIFRVGVYLPLLIIIQILLVHLLLDLHDLIKDTEDIGLDMGNRVEGKVFFLDAE